MLSSRDAPTAPVTEGRTVRQVADPERNGVREAAAKLCNLSAKKHPMQTTDQNQIIEAQVIAFLIERAKEVQSKFNRDEYAKAQIGVLLYGSDCPNSQPNIECIVGAKSMYRHHYGATFMEAMENAGAESPEKRAASNRAEAARLLAEADKLSPLAS
jgi:hypothetical protein